MILAVEDANPKLVGVFADVDLDLNRNMQSCVHAE